MQRETASGRVNFEDFSPLWQPFASETIPGLFYAAARTSEPRLEFWVIRADLTEPSLQVVVNGPAGHQGEANTLQSTRVSSFVRDYGCLAGINAVPFHPVSAVEGEERTCVGIVVSAGVPVSLPAPGLDALVFYRDGRAVIIAQDDIGDLDEVQTAMGGFRIILQEGELPARLLSDTGTPRHDLPRHPRSAAGLSADGRTLYLLVIDGRRPGSVGATEAEIGLILRKLGAASGLNFDGGGSSAMALRFPDGRVRTVNTPIHGGIPGRERAVAGCLGLRAR
ncbi:MAG: phosphodiester glycosidase family protein [Treponema sp.]|nr:phosphodiester glycosidase family protein [Treponema sp.]